MYNNVGLICPWSLIPLDVHCLNIKKNNFSRGYHDHT